MVNQRATNKAIKQLANKPVATIGGEPLQFANNSGDHVKSIKTNTPVNDTDLVNKSYVDTAISGIDLSPYWKSDGTSTATGNWDLGEYDLITNGNVTVEGDFTVGGLMIMEDLHPIYFGDDSDGSIYWDSFNNTFALTSNTDFTFNKSLNTSSVTAGTSTDTFGQAFIINRNGGSVGALDNSSSNVRLKATNANSALVINDSNDGLEITDSSGAILDIPLNMSSEKITSLATGTADTDAVNKGQMDTADALLVPYTGATSNLNLGTKNIYAGLGDFSNMRAATWYFGGSTSSYYAKQYASYGQIFQELQGASSYIFNRAAGGTGNVVIGKDNMKLLFGSTSDASIYFDGSDMYIASQNVTANDELIIKDFDAVDIREDLYFSGSGSGLPFGEIYVNGNTTATTISVQNTWYQFTGFNTNGQSNLTTPDHTNDHITITKAGVYKIDFNVSFSASSGGGKTYEIAVFKNNGATNLTNIHIERKMGASGDIGVAAASGFCSCSANDTIELWIRCTDAVTANATLRDVNLNLIMVGG